MTTVVDVARLAGVSIATVSRVLNDSAHVLPDTREKVLQAISSLDFYPNKAAQTLRFRKSSTVAFAVSDIEQSEESAMTKHMQKMLESIGLDFFLYNLSHNTNRLSDLFQGAERFGISALIISTSEQLDHDHIRVQAERLAQQDIASIMIDYDLSHLDIASVLHDDAAATETSVRFLIESGRSAIAYLGRQATSRTGQERRSGYVRAHESAGLEVDPDLSWDFYFRSPAGYAAVDQAIRRGLKFDAIQCGSDELAMGALAALYDHGIAVPDEVAVVGFGNSPWAMHLRPSLTTLSSSPQEVSVVVRDLLAGKREVPRRTVIHRSFLRRASA